MADRFRLTLAQLNPVLGDLPGNAAKAKAAWEAGRAAGADMVALTEMFLTGYQTQDLVLKPAFTAAVAAALARLAADCAEGPALGIGAPHRAGGKLFNGYFILHGGKVQTVVLKHHLPNSDVFDEKRVFASADVHGPYRIGPLRIGTPICEDSWHPDVCETLAETGAEILLVPNGSPYHRGKPDVRMNLMVARVVETGLPLAYLNMTGGQDDQVFDGASFVLNPGGHLALQMPQFDDAIAHVDFTRGPDGWRAGQGPLAAIPDGHEADYRTMVQGLRDYLGKSGFGRVVLGLSGGIDSAIVAAIAADAIGPQNLRCVMLPSEFTSQTSLEDAAAVARALGCRLDTVPISGPQAAVAAALGPLFAGSAPGVTEENIQSRLRGLLLMALSNKFGAIVLTTGNKSEMATGYATLYGDMAGGFAVLKDISKLLVYRLARWRNAQGPSPVIPERVITRAPSAELRPDQQDQDSLPPYEILDAIMEQYVEHDRSPAQIVQLGFARADVKRVVRLLTLSEYKRRQAPVGVRITPRGFGKDWRFPITNRYRERF
ncbi:MAG: NAD+ synthase [Betaproteobacteria bacterium]